MKALVFIFTFSCIAVSTHAQFHQEKNGTKQRSETSMTNAVSTQTGNQNNGFRGDTEKITHGLRSWDINNPDSWGSAVFHNNGNFTETISDLQTKKQVENNSVVQVTRSKTGTPLLYRRILFKDGRAREVMIHQALRASQANALPNPGKLKYRGELVYDSQGRMIEEQLYAADGTALRRNIQEYSPAGKKLHLKTVDYVKNVPKDLQLIVTEEGEQAARAAQAQQEAQQAAANQPARTGLFNRARANTASPAPAVPTARPVAPPSAMSGSSPSTAPAPEPKRKGAFGKIFKKK
ncbi:MAG: hypothetical protein AAF226_14595 [Verrucomicrobiota bacterium]